jgi:hypothetical protein
LSVLAPSLAASMLLGNKTSPVENKLACVTYLQPAQL